MSEQNELSVELSRQTAAITSLAEAVQAMATASQAQAEAMQAMVQYLIESEGLDEDEGVPPPAATYLDGRPR